MATKEYRIGEFAKQMGVSPDTLKHYEKLGLIEFRRDESNGYRYCDFFECENLFFIRSRVTGQLGLAFGQREYPQTGDEVMESLDIVEREADKKILLATNAKNRARDLRELYYKVNSDVDGYGSLACANERFLFLKFAEDYDFMKRSDEELNAFAEWRSSSPIVSFVIRIHSSSSPRLAFGLMGLPAFIEGYGLATQYAETIEGEFGVLDFKVETGMDNDSPEMSLQHIIKRASGLADHHGIEYSDCYLEDVFITQENNSVQRYIKAHYLLSDQQ